MNKDGKIRLLSRVTRGIGYGFLSVILAIDLKLLGFDEVGICVVLTATSKFRYLHDSGELSGT
jgi:hypothetical protein